MKPQRTSPAPAGALLARWQSVTDKLARLALEQPRATEVFIQGVGKAIDILLDGESR